MPTHSGWSGTPSPGDGLFLEVIAEGEVAQHLKEGAVAGGVADVLDVPVRMHFWQVVTRWRGGSSSPRNHGFMGAMPELMSSRLASFLGTSEKLADADGPCLKEAQEHFPQFIQVFVLLRTQIFMLWRRADRRKNKNSLHPKGTKAV